MRELTRRDVLVGATALGAVAVAGCVADDDDDDPEGEPDGDAGDELDLELVETGITTLSADCGDDDLVEATVEGSSLVLDGMVPSADPCHEAVLNADLTDGALSAGVTLEENLPDEGTCAQCTGVVEYEATLELSEEISDLSVFESVTVEHGGRSGETHRIEEAGTVAGAAARGDEVSDTDGDEDEDRTTEDHADVDPVADSSIETLGENGEKGFDVEWHDDSVVVTGGIEANWRGRYEAVIEEIRVHDGVLSVSVGIEDTTDDDEASLPATGVLEYELVVNLADPAAVEDVDISHDGDRPEASIDD